MKKTFPGYYRPTEEEFSVLWNTCLFVLDANVLLNLYRYSQETSTELIGILKQISDRLWIPHQAALEYQQKRLQVIAQQLDAYNEIHELLGKNKRQLEDKLHSLRRHPYIDADYMLKRMKKACAAIEKNLKKLKQEHPDLLQHDSLRDTLSTLLEGKVGSSNSPERLDEIYKLGKQRYEQEIPPGYKDMGKEGAKKYGDLILWFQVVDKAKETKKPIILVTDDRKDDWWWRFKGQTIGPRPELIDEMLSKAGVSFYLYQTDPFMENAQKFLKRQIKQKAIDEVRDIRRRDEEYVQAIQELKIPSIRLPDEILKTISAIASIRLPDEILKTISAIASIRLPDEILSALQKMSSVYHTPKQETENTKDINLFPDSEPKKIVGKDSQQKK